MRRTARAKMISLALFCFVISCTATFAQDLDGLFKGYEGEWSDVSKQLVALAEATPQEKYTWRPAQGVRSTSEVYMHIVRANFLMLNAIGWKTPADFKPEMATSVTDKSEVIRWLKLSQDAVKQVRQEQKPENMSRKLTIFNIDTTVDSIFLRILVHNNEHMGQLVAYARMTGVVPPWSK
jgi:uncharacterized damage-inducible protein DinB